MNGDLTKHLTSIRRNLDLQLEDLALLKNEKIKIEFYFDNADMHDAVLGARAFYPPFTSENFDIEKFNDKRTLVRSLASSGWLGKIRLLPPHQTEFLGQLNLYFGVGIPKDPRGDAHNFLRDVGIAPPEILKEHLIEKLNRSQLVEFVKREAGSTERLFKAVQCIVPWHRRLARWETQRLLEFGSEKTNYEEIVQNENFLRLKKEFDDRRPNTPIPNFADAAVITMLIEQVRNIKEGSAETVPRFFVPTSLFQDVIDQSEVTPHLSYKNILGATSSVVCDSDYFIYKAAFLPRGVITADDHSKLNETEEALRDLRSKVSEALDVQERVTSEALSKIKVRGRSLNDIIRDLRQLAFLENVWLKYKAPQEAYQALRDVIDASREINENETFQEGITKAKATIEAKLQENAEEFRWISSIWMQVERATLDLRARIHFNSTTSTDFFRDLVLFRFSFPDETHQEISDLLEKILRGAQERDARVSVVSAAYRGRQNPQGELNSLIVASAVMLAARMYQELFVLLNKIKSLPHYSLKIVQTEVLLKLGSKRDNSGAINRRRDKSISNINELEQEFASETDPVTRANLAVGIAYLYFYLWRDCGFDATWRPHQQIKIDPSQAEFGGEYIGKAINYAKDAFDSLDDNPIKKVFALNMYLYFMIEGDGSARKQQIKEAAQRLSAYKNDRRVWLYTFDDTLARYFHLLASLSSNADEWSELMIYAMAHSREAREGSHGNEDIDHYSTLLAVMKSAGFQGGAPANEG